MQRDPPRLHDRLAQLGRQRIDRAALDTGAGHDHLAAHGVRTKRQRHALQWLPLETIAKNVGPCNGEAGIGGPERGYPDAFGGEHLDPRSVGAEPRPAAAAERQHGRGGIDDARSIRRLKQQTTALVPTGPAVTQRELDACRVEPPQPDAQQGRSLERLWKHPAAGADEGRLSQRFAPVAQSLRRKRLDRGLETGRRFAVPGEKLRQRLAMREIESAASGHQEFAAGRRHRIIDGDARAALRKDFRRHQPGRTGTDDGDLGTCHACGQEALPCSIRDIILRSGHLAASRRMDRPPSWFETREDALLTMRSPLVRARAYSLIPALAAACPTYFWVCSNAPCSALAFDMSLNSAKCAATASGVQSDWARLMPSVSMILITAKDPAPAPMMVRVGASSLSR